MIIRRANAAAETIKALIRRSAVSSTGLVERHADLAD
jgi:hypothetical protein